MGNYPLNSNNFTVQKLNEVLFLTEDKRILVAEIFYVLNDLFINTG